MAAQSVASRAAELGAGLWRQRRTMCAVAGALTMLGLAAASTSAEPGRIVTATLLLAVGVALAAGLSRTLARRPTLQLIRGRA